MNMKKMLLVGLLSTSLFACSNATNGGADVTIEEVDIAVVGYEFGPAVPKVIVKLDGAVSGVSKDELTISTAGVERDVTEVYLSDENGERAKEATSNYITIEMPVTFDTTTMSTNGSPFSYSFETFQNTWVTDYQIDLNGLTLTSNEETIVLDYEGNVIENRISTDTARFEVRESFSGEYENPLTKETESLKLQYAAYEPSSLAEGEKNPLIIWLHGQGEGGTDTDITLLGNEVVALAREDIQSHFTAGDQTGAYVLAVQTPTYWMDEGDGTNGAGAGVSRYTDILMDCIEAYVASNSDIDTDRIYLSGGSNGGYMTLNLALHHPDYFAALVPQAAAYSYYSYERNEDGTYKTVESEESLSGTAMVKTDQVYFTEEKVETLKDIPIWFIHSAEDTVVDPTNYALPIYKALVDSGTQNKWFSYFESVEGTDMTGTTYMGHWSWIYFFNDEVTGVQEVSDITTATDLSGFKPSNATNGGSASAEVNGESYDNIFDWLNAQSK